MEKNKTKNIKVFSSICFVFVVIGTIFASAFSTSTTTAETQTCNVPSFSIYFVSTSKSQVENESRTIGKDIMKNGGAGYVWQKENYFYVISSAYENKNDADLVSTQLKNNKIENEVFEVKFDSVNLACPNNTPESKSMLTTALNSFHSTYQNLFDLSVSLDTNIITETSTQLEINSIHAKSDEIMKNFHIVYGDLKIEIINELENSLIDLNESLGLLAQQQKLDEKQTMLSLIRYCYIEICEIYFNFLSTIQ